MSFSCTSVWILTNAFLWVALVAAVAETALTLWLKWDAARKRPSDVGATKEALATAGWTQFIEALSKLLSALKDLPAWVAIFLAGLALLWTAGSVPHLCS